jgi:signal transduction histidine kinase
MSIRTRFILSVVFLLTSLVGMILLVIEKREVQTIFEEQKKKGVLIAENIIQENLEPFLFWDKEGVENNLNKRIDQKLIYVIFYDRDKEPFAANSDIKKYFSIFQKTNLRDDVKPGDFYFDRHDFQPKNDVEPFEILEIEVPIFVEGTTQKWGSVKIGLSLKEMQAEIRKTRLVLLLIGASGFLVGVVGATLLARRITQPIKKLVEATIRISQGDFSQKIHLDSHDEIGELAQSFNKMTAQLLEARKKMEIAQKKLIQAEKLASIGRMSASIAHEIRNPLTSVKLNIQKVGESPHLDEFEREHLALSEEGIRQIEKFIKELLNFARVTELNLEKFSLEQIFEESMKLLGNSVTKKKINLQKEISAELPPVKVDADKIRQVFLNILRNAIEAVEEGGEIKVVMTKDVSQKPPMIKVKITDNGCGIDEKYLETIFEPFFTTKPFGFGLGLANARKIIEQHGGIIKVHSKKGEGACFEILVPIGEEG